MYFYHHHSLIETRQWSVCTSVCTVSAIKITINVTADKNMEAVKWIVDKVQTRCRGFLFTDKEHKERR